MTQLNAQSVRRSMQRFRDLANDLLAADLNTFADRLNYFVEFCRTDSVFAVIHAQLMTNPNVDLMAWYQERVARMGSMAGSASLTFPTNADDRVSLMYQLVEALQSSRIQWRDFSVRFLATGSTKLNEYIAVFSRSVLRPLFRELEYKVADIESELPEDRNLPIPSSVLNVIHNYGNLVQQNAYGDGNRQSAKILIEADRWRTLLQELRQEIEKAPLNSEARARNLEIVSGIESQFSSESPNRAVVQTLLTALPHVGNVATIAPFIMQLFS